MLPILELQKLKVLETFDFYGLHDEQLLNEWLRVNSDKLEMQVYNFGNLKASKNRRKLYASIFNESEYNFPIQSRANFENQINVFKLICTKYIKLEISDLELIERIDAVLANCEWDAIDLFPEQILRAIWKLSDFSTFKEHDLANYRIELLKACREILEIDRE